MAHSLPAALEREVVERFPPPDREAALHLLAQYGADPREKKVQRVRRALLDLSHGRLADLGYYLAAAQHDYRDVLTWAANPHQAPRAGGSA